jgi:hypothetical protein
VIRPNHADELNLGARLSKVEPFHQYSPDPESFQLHLIACKFVKLFALSAAKPYSAMPYGPNLPHLRQHGHGYNSIAYEHCYGSRVSAKDPDDRA